MSLVSDSADIMMKIRPQTFLQNTATVDAVLASFIVSHT